MATDFTQDSVLQFLRSNGGRVKNSDLLAHFKAFVKEHKNHTHNRELFKKFVNSVAVVRQEEGVSYVVLKKKVLGLTAAGDITTGSSTRTCTVQQSPPQARAKERSPSPKPVNRTHDKAQTVRFGTTGETNTISDWVLPAAGIVNNSYLESTLKLEKPVQSSSPFVPHHAPPPVYTEPLLPSYNAAVQKQSKLGSGQNILREELVEPAAPSLPEPNAKVIYVAGGKLDQSKELRRKRSYPPPDFPHTELELPVTHLAQVQQNAAQPPGKNNEAERRKANARLLRTTLEHASSTPCIFDGSFPVTASRAPLPRDSEGTRSNGSLDDNLTASPSLTAESLLTHSNRSLDGNFHLQTTQQPGPKQNGNPVVTPVPAIIPVTVIQQPEERRVAGPQVPPQRSLLLGINQYHTPPAAALAGFPEYHHQASSTLSSSYSSPFLASSKDAWQDWPEGSPGDGFASTEALNSQGVNHEDEQCWVKVHKMLHRAQEAKILSEMQRTKDRPYYHSTGYLDDSKEDRALSTDSLCDHVGSESSSLTGSAHQHHVDPPVLRIMSRLRRRISRSLAADLDQLTPEDSVSARHNRLHLLSSKLGVSHSFSNPSSRTHSSRDLRGETHTRASSNKSINSGHDGSYFHRNPMVPLDTNEHEWLVKGAVGDWPDIYTLFRDDPALLTKRDFITGYTILHWIAKHGDHRVLNTLGYGVEKAGLKLDVDVKTTCGYTPLHLAAIHGNKQIARLLVTKFRANVLLRDNSGKKAWHYLDRKTPKDLFELLGEPKYLTSGSSSMTHSTGDSPRAVTSSAAVKRSTSIAAFLNKTLIKFPGQKGSHELLF